MVEEVGESLVSVGSSKAQKNLVLTFWWSSCIWPRHNSSLLSSCLHLRLRLSLWDVEFPMFVTEKEAVFTGEEEMIGKPLKCYGSLRKWWLQLIVSIFDDRDHKIKILSVDEKNKIKYLCWLAGNWWINNCCSCFFNTFSGFYTRHVPWIIYKWYSSSYFCNCSGGLYRWIHEGSSLTHF